MTEKSQAPEGAPDLRTAFESWALHTPPDDRTNWEVFQAGARAALAAQPQQARAYREANPLGGPAKVFRAMADAIEAGDSYEDTLRRYGYAETQAPAEGDDLRTDLTAAHARIAAEREGADKLRRALEVIAVGDSKDPVTDAGDELVALGYWDADALAAVRAGHPQPKGTVADEWTEEQIDAVWGRYDQGYDTRRALIARILAAAQTPTPVDEDEDGEGYNTLAESQARAARESQDPAVGAQSQEAQDAAWRKWDDTGTIGSLIAFLATLDQAERIVTAYHITLGSGERRCKTRRLTISRERVDHTTSTIRMGDSSLPYTHVMWAHPRELVLDVDEAFKRFANDYWPPAMTDSMRATEAHQRAAFQAGVNAASQPPVHGTGGANG